MLYYSAKMDNAHKEFQKAIGAAVCRYVPERGVLLAISRHENIHRHSSMLQEMHFRNLSQKVNFFYIEKVICMLKSDFNNLLRNYKYARVYDICGYRLLTN